MKINTKTFCIGIVVMTAAMLFTGFRIFHVNHRQKETISVKSMSTKKMSKKELAKNVRTEKRRVEEIENRVDLSGNVKMMKTQFGKTIDGILSTTLYKPTVKKVSLKKNVVIQVKIPYKLELPRYFPTDDKKVYKRRVTDFIRIEAGGTVWVAAPGKKHLISNSNKVETGTATINMFIQRGYSETDLKKYKVKLFEPTGTDLTLLYSVS